MSLLARRYWVIVIVYVLVPPDKMTITYNGIRTEIDGAMQHTIGPVPEGGPLVLVCRVQGGEHLILLLFVAIQHKPGAFSGFCIGEK